MNSRLSLIDYFSSGNSFPVIAESKSEWLVIKLHAGSSGKYSLVSEYIGSKLAFQLGLCSFSPFWLWVDEFVFSRTMNEEVRQLALKSTGYNLAFPYQPGAIVAPIEEVRNFAPFKKSLLFLLDLMLINLDRVPDNPKMLKLNGELYPIDFESSLIVQEILENNSALRQVPVLRQLKSHIFFHKPAESALDSFIQSMRKIDWMSCFEEIPKTVLNSKEKETGIEIIKRKANDPNSLTDLIDQLMEVELESDSERKNRIRMNRYQFESNLLPWHDLKQ